MNRITTLEHMILRDEGRGKSDTFIYTVPKVNKVKAYCKLGKLEDIMEHFNISSIDQLVNILEAWYEVKDLCKKGYFSRTALPMESHEKVRKALEVEENDNSKNKTC